MVSMPRMSFVSVKGVVGHTVGNVARNSVISTTTHILALNILPQKRLMMLYAVGKSPVLKNQSIVLEVTIVTVKKDGTRISKGSWP